MSSEDDGDLIAGDDDAITGDGDGDGDGPRDLDDGPSPGWAGLVAAAAAVVALFSLVGTVQQIPERGWQHAMVALLLATSALLGSYSLARVVQLAIYAATRSRSPRPREPSYALTQAHTLHAIWLIGLGASIAFMGVLGVWSLLDGRPSGLEPGWPLILLGAALSAAGAGTARLTTRTWRRSGGL